MMQLSVPPKPHIFLDACSLFMLDTAVQNERIFSDCGSRLHWFDLLLNFGKKFNVQFYAMDMVVYEICSLLPNHADVDDYFSGSKNMDSPIARKKFFRRAMKNEIPNFRILPSPDGRAKRYLDQLVDITDHYPKPCAASTNALVKAQAHKPEDAGDYSTCKAISLMTRDIEKSGGKVFLFTEDVEMSICANNSNAHTCDVLNFNGFTHAMHLPPIADFLHIAPKPQEDPKDAVVDIYNDSQRQLQITRSNYSTSRFRIIDTDMAAAQLNIWRGAFYNWTATAIALHELTTPKHSPVSIANVSTRFHNRFTNDGTTGNSYFRGRKIAAENTRSQR